MKKILFLTSFLFISVIFSLTTSCSSKYDKLPPRKESETAGSLLNMDEVILKSPSDFTWNFLPLDHKFIAQHQMKEMLIVSSESYNDKPSPFYQGQFEFSVTGRIIQKIGSVLSDFNPNRGTIDTFEVSNYFPYQLHGTYMLEKHYDSEHNGGLTKESEEWMDYSDDLKYLIHDSIANNTFWFNRRYVYENGKLTATYAASRNEAELKTKYNYSNGYLASAEESGGVSFLNYDSDFSYNNAGQCTLRHDKSKDDDITTTFTYDTKNQLTDIVQKSSLSGNSSAHFEYGDDSMLSGITLDLNEPGTKHNIKYKFYYQYNK